MLMGKDKEDFFEVVLVNVGLQLEKRDIEGFWDISFIFIFSNYLDRKLFKGII